MRRSPFGATRGARTGTPSSSKSSWGRSCASTARGVATCSGWTQPQGNCASARSLGCLPSTSLGPVSFGVVRTITGHTGRRRRLLARPADRRDVGNRAVERRAMRPCMVCGSSPSTNTACTVADEEAFRAPRVHARERVGWRSCSRSVQIGSTAVACRVEKLVRVATTRPAAGLGLPVADDAGDDQIRIVDAARTRARWRSRARPLRGSIREPPGPVARDSSGKRKLLEQPLIPSAPAEISELSSP